MQTKKKKIKIKSLLIVSIVVTLVLSGTLGFLLGRLTTKQTTMSTDETIYSKLATIIENQYFDTTDDDTSLEDQLLSGMISGLNDPYSTYMNSASYSEFVSGVNGTLKGVGVSYLDYGIGAMVTEVYNDSPASEAGILKGDLITSINGTPLKDNTEKTIKELLTEKDTTYLTFYRDGKKKSVKVTLKEISISVTYEVRDDKVGYLRVSTFGSTTAGNIEKALKSFEKNNIKTICLDLRGNGGGYLKTAQDVLNLFIPTGVTMFKTQNKSGKTDYKSDSNTKYTFDQGFVLVDNQTASASEIVTASLSEILNYQVIGEKTYGKGIVQTEIPLSSTQTIKLTTCKWLTPNGNYIQDEGITPHYEVSNTTLYDYTFDVLDDPLEYDQVDGYVIYMQKALKALNYKVDRTDGYFSNKTATALKQFQIDNNLKMNGRLDNQDAIILFSKLGTYYSNTDKVYTKMKELVK